MLSGPGFPQNGRFGQGDCWAQWAVGHVLSHPEFPGLPSKVTLGGVERCRELAQRSVFAMICGALFLGGRRHLGVSRRSWLSLGSVPWVFAGSSDRNEKATFRDGRVSAAITDVAAHFRDGTQFGFVACQRDGTTVLPRAWDHLGVWLIMAVIGRSGQP